MMKWDNEGVMIFDLYILFSGSSKWVRARASKWAISCGWRGSSCTEYARYLKLFRSRFPFCIVQAILIMVCIHTKRFFISFKNYEENVRKSTIVRKRLSTHILSFCDSLSLLIKRKFRYRTLAWSCPSILNPSWATGTAPDATRTSRRKRCASPEDTREYFILLNILIFWFDEWCDLCYNICFGNSDILIFFAVTIPFWHDESDEKMRNSNNSIASNQPRLTDDLTSASHLALFTT